MPRSFFDKNKLLEINYKEPTIRVKKNNIISCEECGLYKHCNSPKMEASGEGRLGILIIAEAPGAEEDLQGTQLVGRSGRLLREVLHLMDLDLDRDFWKTNAISCRPQNNKTPSILQINACRNRVKEVIDKYKPKVIIPMGYTAMISLVGDKITGRIKGLSMTDWAGCIIPDQDYKCWICPTWHPSYIIRNEDGSENSVVKKQFINNIREAVKLAEKPFYTSNYLSDCIVIDKMEEAIDIIHKMREVPIVAFDYETTGKKPYRKGHRIVCASISDGVFGYSFPFFDDDDFRNEWKGFLLSKTQKIAHNAKFERTWTKVLLGYWPKNIKWDTLLAAHILNNNKKVGLKYLLYITLGIIGYDKDIDKYLESKSEDEELHGANAFNNIDKVDIYDLMKYNAMDSLGTYKLYEYQKSKFTDNFYRALNLFMEGEEALTKAEYNGIYYDTEQAEKLKKSLDKRLIFLENEVMQSEVLKKWDKEKPFRISNTNDLSHLIFDILGYKPHKVTEITGRPKSDKEEMKFYNIPIVEDVMNWRRWYKVSNTYLTGFNKECIDSVIHPFFNLYGVKTYRSSSQNPNLQNIPKRDTEVSTMLRKLLFPRKGHKIGEYDYNAMEVAIIACSNKDPNLIKYITEGGDMHKDIASLLFLKDPKEITKKERYLAKNGFVFPTFYGSYYKHTGEKIWESLEPETKKHLKDEGIYNMNAFINHVHDVEDNFWFERFPVAYEYKEKVIADYEKKGYVEMFTGFRCYAPMSRNQVLNSPIQGAAFHCLLYTFINVTNELEKNKMDTRLIGEIHDAIIPDINPDEEKQFDNIIWYYGTQKIREDWDWIIVPLKIEKSISNVDESWAKVSEVGLLNAQND